MKRAILCLGFVSFAGFGTIDRSHAQAVVPDGTLNTTVTRTLNDFTIRDGTAAGTNLFHSFQEFSIPTGGSATFDNAPTVQNIFSRITGGTASNIDGMIRANGSANLFLLNPNGILFGTNARLDIGGSFVSTTAQAIQFADNTEFSALNSTAPLLTMSVPIGLQFGANPSPIRAIGNGHNLRQIGLSPFNRTQAIATLQVRSGKTLALIGGDVNLEGAVLRAEQGRIELGSVGANATVPFQSIAQGWQFNYQPVPAFQDIQLTKKVLLDASGNPGGTIRLQGRNITLLDSSFGLIQHLGTQPSGQIQVQASEVVKLQGVDQGIASGFMVNNFSPVGKAPDIQLTASQLLIQNGILSSVTAGGRGGDIIVKVAETVRIAAPIPLGISTSGFGRGQAGNVIVSAGELVLDNGVLASNGSGAGSAGDIFVNANAIALVGFDARGQSSYLGSGVIGTGNAANVTVNTKQLTIRDGGRIESVSYEKGNAGNIAVTASEFIDISGKKPNLPSTVDEPSYIGSSAEPPPLFLRQNGLVVSLEGNAGMLTIRTPDLRISDEALIAVRNRGSGNGGRLDISADSITLKNQGRILSSTSSGNGGDIDLTVGNHLLLRSNSQISTWAGGTGNGGNISIQSPIVLGLENSDIIANASGGRGGNIDITTQGIIGLEFRNTPDPRRDRTNDITASSGIGINGTVQINNIGVDPNAGLVELSETLSDDSQKVAAGCTSTQGSSFVITGRGGVPQSPSDRISLRPWADLRSLSPSASTVARPAPQVLLEATTWHRNSQTGKVELTAAQPAQITQSATCS